LFLLRSARIFAVKIKQMATDSVTPGEALARLKAGNERFVTNQRVIHDLMEQVKETAGGQKPFATIVGCIDSRVVPELIFDQGIGSLFSVRVAGNVISEDVLASLEFACTVADTRLIIVKGHTRCGAVESACLSDGTEPGYLPQLIAKIAPSIAAAKQKLGDEITPELKDKVSKLNVLHSVAEIREKSPVLKKLEEEGTIKIIGARYDVSTGVVTFYE
jgi:carbonic anhydrase